MAASGHHLSCFALSFFFLCIHAKLDTFSIIRPFAVVDAKKLVSSFVPWDTFLPCDRIPTVPVDLLLCFSQDLSTNPEATLATQTVIAEFLEQKHPWHRCFRSVQAVGTNLTAAQDMYRPTDPVHTGNWVNGPNQQFITMARAFEDGIWGNYSAWFLMEMDCKARRSGWLTELLEEVEDRAPFAVLGSFYRGDLWDSFAMPPAIRFHINGNAVYNTTNPLFQLLVAKLEGILATGMLTTAFDVELAELYLDSNLTAEEFGWFAGDSQIIGNYARVPMVESYFSNEALVHGAWMYEAWNPKADPVALVVSDFGSFDTNGVPLLVEFVQRLLKGHHPFREVVVVRSRTHTPRELPTENQKGISFRQVERPGSAWMDWCKAPVNSPWFVYTNVFFDFGRRIDLLQTLHSHLPVVPFIYSNCPFCTNYPYCLKSLAHASSFVGQSVDRHFELSQMVFNTAARNVFCSAWQAWHDSPHNSTEVKAPGPTADDYAAYLKKTGQAGLYSFVDGTKHGHRPIGIYHPTNHTRGNSSMGCGNNTWGYGNNTWDYGNFTGICDNFTGICDNFTGICGNFSFCNSSIACGNFSFCNLSNRTNASNMDFCEYASDEAECTALAGCSWRPHFETCFYGALVTVPKAPNFTLRQSFGAGCQDGLVLPTILITNGGAEPLQLEVDVPTPFITLPNISVGAHQESEVHLQLEPGFYDLLPLLSKMMTLRTLATAPHLVQSIEVVTVDVGQWGVSMTPNRTIHGTVVLVTVSAPITTHIALHAEVTLDFVSSVFVSDIWTLSADPDAPNTIAFDTGSVPPDVYNVTIAVQQTAILAQGNVTRCYSLQLALAPPLTAVCDVEVSITPPMANSGDTIVVQATGQTADIISYRWAIDTDAPSVATSVPWATLQVPFRIGSATMPIVVTMQDSYGRIRECSSSLLVNGVIISDLGAAPHEECSDEADFSSVLAVDTCLQISQQLLPLDSGAARTLMKKIFAQMTKSVHTNTTIETNRLLGRLDALAEAAASQSIDGSLVQSFADVLAHLSNTSPLDASSTLHFINAGASLLKSILQLTSMPAAGTNNAMAFQSAVFLTNLLEETLVRATCSDESLYSYTTAHSSNNCINVTWGLQTPSSIPGEHDDFTIYLIQDQAAPPRLNVILLSISPECNALRSVLQSTAQLHRLLFINASSCARISLINQGPMWQIPLVFGAPVIPSSESSHEHPKHGIQSLQSTCIIMENFGGPFDATPAKGGVCSASAPAWVTGTDIQSLGQLQQAIMDGLRSGSNYMISSSQSSGVVDLDVPVPPGSWSSWWLVLLAITSIVVLVTGTACWVHHYGIFCFQSPCHAKTTPSHLLPGKHSIQSSLSQTLQADGASAASQQMGQCASLSYGHSNPLQDHTHYPAKQPHVEMQVTDTLQEIRFPILSPLVCDLTCDAPMPYPSSIHHQSHQPELPVPMHVEEGEDAYI